MGQGADVGATLRGYRARFSIKQDALARALGVSQGQLSRWESGRERPGARNRDVIDALIHGRADPLLAGLIHYVRGARAPLALFDARLAIVAASPTLTGMGAPLARFGWLFDPDINPALDTLQKRFIAMSKSGKVLALEIPFSHEAVPWACLGRLTVSRIGSDITAIAEMVFTPDERQTVRQVSLRAAPGPAR